MVTLHMRNRNSPLLTPSALPCLRSLPTLNITQGCALGCRYCYIQGYTGYPGCDQVILFENTASLVAAELARKRKRPRRVYLSPSSDAFQYLPDVQRVTHDTLRVLLEQGVESAFLTKGYVAQQFLQLFSQHAPRVHAQVGITTLDRRLARQLEPRAACPALRLRTMRTLVTAGCATSARLDPLIPDVTDRLTEVEQLLKAVAATGVRRVAASYLFIRPRLRRQITELLAELSAPRTRDWHQQAFEGNCGGGRCLDEPSRRERFARIGEIASRYGMELVPCRCKNPGLVGTDCQIAGGSPPYAGADGCDQEVFDWATP